MAWMMCVGQVADYWRMVIDINDYQKNRFVERVINGMFNTVSNKKIAVSGRVLGCCCFAAMCWAVTVHFASTGVAHS